MNPKPDSETDHHSLSEVHEAIDVLTDEDYKRLMTYALLLCSRRIRGSVFAPEDLLQEALTRTLRPGSRRWKKGIPFDQHVDQVMRSISSDHARKAAAHPILSLPETDEEEEISAQIPSSCKQLEPVEERVLSVFEENPIARDIVFLQADDLSASAIQKELGISKTDYESTCKWIRRWRAAFLKQGDT